MNKAAKKRAVGLVGTTSSGADSLLSKLTVQEGLTTVPLRILPSRSSKSQLHRDRVEHPAPIVKGYVFGGADNTRTAKGLFLLQMPASVRDPL